MKQNDKKLRILIVEDEILLSIELEYVLQELGHDIVGVAASSQEALDLAKKTKPDLALVDIHLSDGPTGVELANELSASGGTRCVFMSANVNRIPDDYAGAVGYIGKPYTESGFKTAISYLRDGLTDPPPTEKRPHSLTLSPFFQTQWAA
jgi:two-component SAPR family response regulator